MKVRKLNVPPPYATPYAFYCPACDDIHQFWTGENQWQWNGDLEKPTVTPSILVNGDRSCPSLPRCHIYVTDGKIHYLEDCSHDMKGQVVDIPEIPYGESYFENA